MPLIIDAHEDIAYNALSYDRDYRRSVKETRRLEVNKPIPSSVGDTLLGWEEYQRAQIGIIFSTIFIVPKRYQKNDWESSQTYANPKQAYPLLRSQLDYYVDLCDSTPDKFRLIFNRKDFVDVLKPWDETATDFPKITHPIGLIISMEGAEGIQSPGAMEEWWERGVRIVGPVWAGGRFCGGTREHGSFTSEGFELLEIMANLGFILDISHMDNESALQAIEHYQGNVIASHANAQSLLKEDPNQRQLTDSAIRNLVGRDGIIGCVPYNRFLKADWKNSDGKQNISLEMFVEHIDYICQLAGDARHTGLGTDFDGGVGLPHVPAEIDSIVDMPKIVTILQARGYQINDINAIMGDNWRRLLNLALPEG